MRICPSPKTPAPSLAHTRRHERLDLPFGFAAAKQASATDVSRLSKGRPLSLAGLLRRAETLHETLPAQLVCIAITSANSPSSSMTCMTGRELVPAGELLAGPMALTSILLLAAVLLLLGAVCQGEL